MGILKRMLAELVNSRTPTKMHPSFPPTFLSAIIGLLAFVLRCSLSRFQEDMKNGVTVPAVITSLAHNVLFKSKVTFIRRLPRFLLTSEHLELDHRRHLKPTNDKGNGTVVTNLEGPIIAGS